MPSASTWLFTKPLLAAPAAMNGRVHERARGFLQPQQIGLAAYTNSYCGRAVHVARVIEIEVERTDHAVRCDLTA